MIIHRPKLRWSPKLEHFIMHRRICPSIRDRLRRWLEAVNAVTVRDDNIPKIKNLVCWGGGCNRTHSGRKCERVTGPQPERVRSFFAGVNATRTSGTGPERDRNGTGTGPERDRDRDRNGTGTGPERDRNGNGTGTGPGPGPERDRNGTGTGPGPERDRNGTGTGPERDRNGTGTGTGPERDRNGTGTGPERDRNGTGTGPERDRNANRNRCEHGLSTVSNIMNIS